MFNLASPIDGAESGTSSLRYHWYHPDDTASKDWAEKALEVLNVTEPGRNVLLLGSNLDQGADLQNNKITDLTLYISSVDQYADAILRNYDLLGDLEKTLARNAKLTLVVLKSYISYKLTLVVLKY